MVLCFCLDNENVSVNGFIFFKNMIKIIIMCLKYESLGVVFIDKFIVLNVEIILNIIFINGRFFEIFNRKMVLNINIIEIIVMVSVLNMWRGRSCFFNSIIFFWFCKNVYIEKIIIINVVSLILFFVDVFFVLININKIIKKIVVLCRWVKLIVLNFVVFVVIVWK